jgi:hypothetical protein
VIDPKMFSLKQLVATLIDSVNGGTCDWHKDAEIVPKYVSPNAAKNERPICVVRCAGSFLRCSCGPRQGYFWDIYGDDMQTPERALLALYAAPPPSQLLKRAAGP